VLDYRTNGWVMELHKDDVVLARGWWWRGSARSELPTMGSKVVTAALVGGEACDRSSPCKLGTLFVSVKYVLVV
jgi:hypothetical protein